MHYVAQAKPTLGLRGVARNQNEFIRFATLFKTPRSQLLNYAIKTQPTVCSVIDMVQYIIIGMSLSEPHTHYV